jgi:hypothetical protein
MPLLLNELKERIAMMFDVCLLCELLDIEPEEILDRFEDKLLDNLDDFKGLEDED